MVPGSRASVQLTKLVFPGTRPHPGTGGILALACRATGLFLRLGRDGERRGYDLEHSILVRVPFSGHPDLEAMQKPQAVKGI